MEFSLETERLILRDFREEDTEIIVEQFAEPSIRNKILKHQADKSYIREYIRRAIVVAQQKPRDYFALAITLKDTRTVIGSCSIYNVFSESIDAGLGWNFGKAYWEQGYATETTMALLEIGFNLNEVNRVSADCFADNRAAIRVLNKAGMSPYNRGRFFQWVRAWKYSEKRPIARYCIWREEWFNLTAKQFQNRPVLR